MGGIAQAGETLPLLLQLVSKSLVIADMNRPATRYRLSETVRQFAVEKLSDAGQFDSMHERLAEYLIDLASQKINDSTTAVLNQLEAELGNMRAIMAWARALPDAGRMTLRLVTAFQGLWNQRAQHVNEMLAWIDEVLARDDTARRACGEGAGLSDLERLKAVYGRLWLLAAHGYRLRRWSAHADELLQLSERVEDSPDKFYAVYVAAYVAIGQHELDRAAMLCTRAIGLIERFNLPYPLMRARWMMGWIHFMRGDQTSAVGHFMQVLRIVQQHLVPGRTHLPLIGLIRADPEAGLAMCKQELARHPRHPAHATHSATYDDPEEVAILLQMYAQALIATGDYPRAQAVLDECLSLWQGLGIWSNYGNGITATLHDQGIVAYLRGDVTAAASHFTLSLQQAVQQFNPHQIAHRNILLSYCLLAQGDTISAPDRLRHGLHLFRELDQPPGIALALAGFGMLAESLGQLERAAMLFATAPAQARAHYLPSVLRPADSTLLAHICSAARGRLGGPALARAWADSERMTLEQAVACTQSL